MQKDINEKNVVFAIVLIFLVLTVAPAVNAQIAGNDFNGIKSMVQKFSNTTVNFEDNSIYDLLILTPQEFFRKLKPLVNHKNSFDVSTICVTLDEVYDQMYWQGRDHAEKIKYFIKNAFDKWGIKYALLVGDFRHMPVRYVFNGDVNGGFYEPCFISELYYADIYDENGDFSSWDSDGDGIYGEWIDDGISNVAEDKDINLRPDVYVGRLACRNIQEVKIMVSKIITYEATTYNQNWFKRLVVVAGDTYPEGQYPFDTSGYEGEENTMNAIENMSGFEVEKLWISLGTFKRPKDVIDAINKGCGFMFFDGHASPIAWGTHPHNSEKFIYGLRLKDMWRMRNLNKMPIVIAGACHNSEFDVTPLNLLHNFTESLNHGTYPLECWAWKLTSKPFGGSIATIANTGLGMSKEDKDSMEGAGDYMDLQFFCEYGTNGSEILGEVWGKAINRYLNRYPIDWDTPAAWDYAYDAKTVQQWVLLGDPSLKIGGYSK